MSAPRAMHDITFLVSIKLQVPKHTKEEMLYSIADWKSEREQQILPHIH